MFTIRVERRDRRDVFESESYSVSRNPQGLVRVLLVGVSMNTPSFIDIADGEVAYVMNKDGKTIDSVRSSNRDGSSRVNSVFRATQGHK